MFKDQIVRKVIAFYENFERDTRHGHPEGRFSLSEFDKLKIKKTEPAPEPPKLTFNEFFAAQIKARDKELKWNTYRQQMACLNPVHEFNPSITFEDLKYKFLDELHHFMVSKGHCNSTSNKRHKKLVSLWLLQ
jgi:hypothetical protein